MIRGDLDRARADDARSAGDLIALVAIAAVVAAIAAFLSGCGGADFGLGLGEEIDVEAGFEVGVEIGGGGGDDGRSDDGGVGDAGDRGDDDGGAADVAPVDAVAESPPPPVDCAPPVDSGASDSGPKDTGTVAADTGTADTGTADTGPADTGPADTGTAADVKVCQEGTTMGYPPGEDCALGSLDCCKGPCVYVATMCCGRGRCM